MALTKLKGKQFVNKTVDTAQLNDASVTLVKLATDVTQYIDNQVSGLGNNFEWQTSVISIVADAPPAPTTGDRYLISASPSGTFAGHANQIAQWTGSAWTYTTCTLGTYVSVDDVADAVYFFGGTSWVARNFMIYSFGAEFTIASNIVSINAIDQSKITNLVSDLATITTNITNANNAINQEILDRQTGDADTLTSAKAYTDAEINTAASALESYADGAIADEATERIAQDAATLASANGYTDTAISTEVTNRNNAIGTETTRAADAEDALNTRIDNVLAPIVGSGLSSDGANSLSLNFKTAKATAGNNYVDLDTGDAVFMLVIFNGNVLELGVGNDYTFNKATGRVTLEFSVEADDKLLVIYAG